MTRKEKNAEQAARTYPDKIKARIEKAYLRGWTEARDEIATFCYERSWTSLAYEIKRWGDEEIRE
jgi:hypothetical protein